ncbi:hypothetical protein CGRA01v4_01061 [Colletotrichum graminicola]|nr:hypothetical protein CGRA01v4_01061 [Colletotrichum graminicola]
MHPAGSSFFFLPPTSITYAFLLGITASHLYPADRVAHCFTRTRACIHSAILFRR